MSLTDVIIPPWAKIVGFLVFCAALVGGGGYVGWHEESVRASAVLSKAQKEFADEKTRAVSAALEAQRKQLDDQHSKELALAKVDQEELNRLKGAEDETNRLRRCLRDGTCGLRIAAHCPAAPTGHVLSAAPSASVDPGATAELDESARQSYLALRKGIDKVASQLRACQTAIRTYTGQP